jgi:hypothetical protein
LADDKGEVVVNNQGTQSGELVSAMEGMPFYVALPVPPQAPAGQYVLKITVRDPASGQQAAMSRTLTVKPAELAIVAPRLFYDAQRKVPAPDTWAAGQPIYLRFRAIGADRSQGRVEVAMEVQVVDQDGKPVLQKPIQTVLRAADAETVRKADVLTFTAELLVTRVGQFTLRITLDDRIANKTVKAEMPIRTGVP